VILGNDVGCGSHPVRPLKRHRIIEGFAFALRRLVPLVAIAPRSIAADPVCLLDLE
jgi:hypothetical protein